MKQGKMVLLSLGLLLGVSFELSLQMGCSSDNGNSEAVATKSESKEIGQAQAEKTNEVKKSAQKETASTAQEQSGSTSSEEDSPSGNSITDVLWKRQGKETVLRHDVAVKSEKGCLYQIEAKGPRAFSDQPLVKLGFPNASPIVVFEGEKELVQGNLKKIRGEECLGAYRYSKTIVEISPTSKDVNPADLKIKMSESLPLKRGNESYWWLYGNTKNNIASKIPKEWQGKKGMLHVEGHYLGAKVPSKLPQLMYNKKGNNFIAEEGTTLLVSKQEVDITSGRFSFALFSPSGSPFVLITKCELTIDGQTHSFMQ